MQTKNLRFLHVFWFTLITPNVIMIIRKSGRSERGCYHGTYVSGTWLLDPGNRTYGFRRPYDGICAIVFAQAVAFVFLGYLNFSERTYIVMFWGYMIISFVGFTYWSVFKMDLPF